MHTAAHNVAASIVIVGFVSCVIRIIVVIVVVAGPIEAADKEPAPVVEATVAEAAVLETIPRKATALNSRRNSRGTDRARSREAAAKPYTPTAEATSETTMAATKTTTMAAASAAVATAPSAATARQSYVRRQHSN
jgi:hypothetical protein